MRLQIGLSIACAIGLTSPALGQAASLDHATICPGVHDPVSASDLVAKMKRSAIPSIRKDEFETTSQYGERIKQAAIREFPTSSISVSSHLPPYQLSYDADASRLTVVVARHDLYVHRSDLLVSELDHNVLTTGYYDAQNSYGASVKVEKQSITEFVISWGEGAGASYEVKAYVDVSPDEARELKRSADIVLAGTMVEPFIQRRSDLRLPTLDYPTRREIQSYAVFLTPTCLYLRNAAMKPYGLRIVK